MRIPREFFEQFSVEQRMEMLRDPDMLRNAYFVFGNTETKLDTPKPVIDYVEMEIPDWLEAEILELSKDVDEIALLVTDLGGSLWLLSWLSHPSAKISEQANEWLKTQSRDTFKALLQWVAMELI
jgi:hypothetical protein